VTPVHDEATDRAVGGIVIEAAELEASLAVAIQFVRGQADEAHGVNYVLMTGTLQQMGGALREFRHLVAALPAGVDRDEATRLADEVGSAFRRRNAFVHSFSVRWVDDAGKAHPAWLHPKTHTAGPFDHKDAAALQGSLQELHERVDAWSSRARVSADSLRTGDVSE
jgi:hypothetical protein